MATKHRRPIRLIHYEAFLGKEDGIKREKYLKVGKGHEEMKVLLETTFSNINYMFRRRAGVVQ